MPTVTYDQIVPREPKPAISHDETYVAVVAKGQTESQWRLRGTMLNTFHEEVERVFDKSHLFSGINAGKETSEYTFNLVLRTGGSASLSQFYPIFFSIMTLGLIPSCGDDVHYHLIVEAKKADQTMKKYEYSQKMITCVQFPFLLPLAWSHNRERVEKEIIDNMLLVFLRDFEKDRGLSGEGSTVINGGSTAGLAVTFAATSN